MADLFDILTYDSVKAVDTLDISEVYTQIAILSTPSREAGKYLVAFSLTWSLASTSKSAFMRFRLDSGAWNEFISEPQDKSDRRAIFYEFPQDLLAGVHTVELEARKEDAGTGQFDILFLDLIIQRVG